MNEGTGSGSKSRKKQIAPFILDTFGCATILDEKNGDLYTRDSSSSGTILGTGEFLQLEPEASPILDFITPCFTFMRWVLLSHCRFEFDLKTQSFRYYPGSIFRKMMVSLVQLTVIVATYAESRWINEEMAGRPLLVMYKLMNLAYIFFNVAFYLSIRCNGPEFCDIFNFTQGMTDMIRKSGCIIPRRKIVKFISMGTLTLFVVHGLLYVLNSADGQSGHSFSQGPKIYLENCADFGARNFWSIFMVDRIGNESHVQLKQYYFSQHYSTSIVMFVGLFWMAVSMMAAITWLSAFLMTLMWGLLFWKVLHIFFKVIGHSPIRNTLEDIRKFNTITRIMDKFNGAFGWTILAGVLTGVAHFSVNIFGMFSNDTDWLDKVVVGFSFLMFGAQLLASAQVNHMASKITDLIKSRYQTEPVWREFHGQCVETLQGMLLVFHEIQSNKLGFRGLGFFTINYGFIGTVLSVISTYSVVVLQLQGS